MRAMVRLSRGVLMLALALAATGCAGSQKVMPSMRFGSMGIETNFDRDDVVVLDTVTGTSTTDRRFFFVSFVDGDKVRVFGIPFFKDKYTFSEPGFPIIGNLFPGTADRAYYNALEKTPDADFVLVKSFDHESSGIPWLWERETVTFRGKAMKVRADGK